MTDTASITVTPFHVADLLAEGELMPVYVHVVDHPQGRVLVDTGLTQLHPAVADMDPRLHPLSEQDLDLAGIDLVVNTHLHLDHCGGNALLASRPTCVELRELDEPTTDGRRIIRALDRAEVSLAHTREPWRPGSGTSPTGSPHPAGRPE